MVRNREWTPVFGITEKPVIPSYLRHFGIPVLKLQIPVIRYFELNVKINEKTHKAALDYTNNKQLILNL